MIETVLRIVAPHFVAGVVLRDDKAVFVAPINNYMRGWTQHRVEAYCERKGWQVEVMVEKRQH